jgi:hypothetical protein
MTPLSWSMKPYQRVAIACGSRGRGRGPARSSSTGCRAYPDNLSYNGRGLFWVALAAPCVEALDRLAGAPWLRQVLFRLPAALTDVRPPAVAWVLGVDVQGAVWHHLRETSGRYAHITSVQEFDGALWLGSLFGRSVGRAQAPKGL